MAMRVLPSVVQVCRYDKMSFHVFNVFQSDFTDFSYFRLHKMLQNNLFGFPAGICIFRFTIPAMDPDAEIILFHTHLPLDEMNLRVRFHWYASKRLPRLLVWYVVGNWIAQWTNDIMYVHSLCRW